MHPLALPTAKLWQGRVPPFSLGLTPSLYLSALPTAKLGRAPRTAPCHRGGVDRSPEPPLRFRPPLRLQPLPLHPAHPSALPTAKLGRAPSIAPHLRGWVRPGGSPEAGGGRSPPPLGRGSGARSPRRGQRLTVHRETRGT